MEKQRTQWLSDLVSRALLFTAASGLMLLAIEFGHRLSQERLVPPVVTALAIVPFGLSLRLVRGQLSAVKLERLRLRSIVLVCAVLLTMVGIGLFVAQIGGRNLRFIEMVVSILGISHLLAEYRAIETHRRARAILLGAGCIGLSAGGVYWKSTHPATGLLVASAGAAFGYFAVVTATEHMRHYHRASTKRKSGDAARQTRPLLFLGLVFLVLSGLLLDTRGSGTGGSIAILVVLLIVFAAMNTGDSDLLLVVLLVALWWATGPTTSSADAAVLPAPAARVETELPPDPDQTSSTALDNEPTQPDASEGPALLLVFGDSFISGEGASEYVDGTNERGKNECRRATTTHHHLIASRDDVMKQGLDNDALDNLRDFPGSVVSVACSGAVAANITTTPQVSWQPPLHADDPPVAPDLTQLDLATAYLATTDVPVGKIMLSVGGNDALFSTLVGTCFAPGDCSDVGQYFVDQLEKFHLEENASKIDPEASARVENPYLLDGTYRAIAAFAEAHGVQAEDVLVIPYPQPLAKDSCGLLLSNDEHDFVNFFVSKLNERLRALAEGHDFTFVDTVQTALAVTDRRLCDSDSDWLGGSGLNFLQPFPVGGDLTTRLNPLNWLHNSVHPNEQAHIDIAQAILRFDADADPTRLTINCKEPAADTAGSDGQQTDVAVDSSVACYVPNSCPPIERAANDERATDLPPIPEDDGCLSPCGEVLRDRENAEEASSECPSRWAIGKLRDLANQTYLPMLAAFLGSWMIGVWALAFVDAKRFGNWRRNRTLTGALRRLRDWLIGKKSTIATYPGWRRLVLQLFLLGLVVLLVVVLRIHDLLRRTMAAVTGKCRSILSSLIDGGIFGFLTAVFLVVGLLRVWEPGLSLGAAALLQMPFALRWVLRKAKSSPNSTDLASVNEHRADSSTDRDPFASELRHWERVFREFRYPILGWAGVFLFVTVVLLNADGQAFTGVAFGTVLSVVLGAALFPMVVSRPHKRSSQVALLVVTMALSFVSGALWPTIISRANDAPAGTLTRDLPLIPGGLLALALVVGASIVDGALRRPETDEAGASFVKGITNWIAALPITRMADLHVAQTATAAGLVVAAVAAKQLDGPPAYAIFGLVVAGTVINWWASFMGHSGHLWPFATVGVLVGIITVELSWDGGWLHLGRLVMSLLAIYTIARVFSARTLRLVTLALAALLVAGVYASGADTLDTTRAQDLTDATPEDSAAPPQGVMTDETPDEIPGEDPSDSSSSFDALEEGLRAAWQDIFRSLGVDDPPVPGLAFVIVLLLPLILAYRWVETVNGSRTRTPVVVEDFTTQDGFKDGAALTSQLQSELARAGITDPPFVPTAGLPAEVLGLFESGKAGPWAKAATGLVGLARPKRGTIVSPTLESNTEELSIVTVRVKDGRTNQVLYAASFHASNVRLAVRKAVAYIARNTLAQSVTTPEWARWESEDGLALRHYLESRSSSHYGTPISLEQRATSLQTSIAASPSTGLVRVELGHVYELLEQPWRALRIHLEAAEHHTRLVPAHYRAATALSMIAGELLGERTTLDDKHVSREDRLMIATSLVSVLDQHTNGDHPYLTGDKLGWLTDSHPTNPRELAFAFLDAAEDIVSGVLRIMSTPVLMLNALVHQDERAHWTATLRNIEARRHETGRYLVLRDLIRIRRLLAFTVWSPQQRHGRQDALDEVAAMVHRQRSFAAAEQSLKDVENLVLDYGGAGALYNQSCVLAIYAGYLEDNYEVFNQCWNEIPEQGEKPRSATQTFEAAIEGYKQQSVDKLFASRAHVGGGFPSIEWIEKDPDLLALHDVALFRQLIAWMEHGQKAIELARNVKPLEEATDMAGDNAENKMQEVVGGPHVDE